MQAPEITTPPTLRIVPWFQLFAFSREESGTLSRLTLSGELRPGSRQPKHVELVIRRGETATAFRPSSVTAERHGGNRAERRRGESGIGLKLQFSVPAALLEDRQSHFRLLARKSGALDLPWPVLESVAEESTGMRFSVGALAAAAGLGAATLLAAPAAALADSGTPAPLTTSDDSSQPQSSDQSDTSQCTDPSDTTGTDPSDTADSTDPSQCPDPGDTSTDPTGTTPGNTSTDPSGTPAGGGDTSTDPSGTPAGGGDTSTDPSGTPAGGGDTSTDPSGTPAGGGDTSTDPSGTPAGGGDTSTDPSGTPAGGGDTSTDPSGTPAGGGDTSTDPSGTPAGGDTSTDADTTTASADTTSTPAPVTPAPVAATTTTDTTPVVPVTSTPTTPPATPKTTSSTKKTTHPKGGGASVSDSTKPTKNGKSGGDNSGGNNPGGGNSGGAASIIEKAVKNGIDLKLSGKVTPSSHTGNEQNATGGSALDKPKKSSTPTPPPSTSDVQVSSFTPVDPSTVGTWGGGSIWSNPFTSAQLQRFAALVGGTTKPPNYLVDIYKQAARKYHLPWEILAAINYVETDYGSDLAVSTSGAEGWMEFMPGTWAEYGEAVSRNGRILGDKPGNPWDPRDAIFSAAKLLVQDGARKDLARAVFGYNHAGWYVQKVLSTAMQLTSDNLEANVARRAHDEKSAPKDPLTTVQNKEFGEAPVQSAKQDGQDIVFDELKSMTTTAKLLNGINYQWGGGHANWVVSTGYDCSGFVSEVLHTAGYLTTPQTTQTLPAQQGISSGAGKWVTIYDRTDEAIDSDHVIIDIDGQFWESGGGGPAGAPRVHRIYNVSPSYLKTFNLRLHPEGL